MKRYELTKEQWEQVKAVLPAERSGKRGRPRKDDRRMRNGMLWIARSGARWRDGGTLEAPYSAHCPQGMTMNQSMPLNCWKR